MHGFIQFDIYMDLKKYNSEDHQDIVFQHMAQNIFPVIQSLEGSYQSFSLQKLAFKIYF
eukprot:gene5855-11824_t